MKFHKVKIYCIISGSGNPGDKAQRRQRSLLARYPDVLSCSHGHPQYTGTARPPGFIYSYQSNKNLLFLLHPSFLLTSGSNLKGQIHQINHTSLRQMTGEPFRELYQTYQAGDICIKDWIQIFFLAFNTEYKTLMLLQDPPIPHVNFLGLIVQLIQDNTDLWIQLSQDPFLRIFFKN